MSDAATESEGWEGSSWLSSILVNTFSITMGVCSPVDGARYREQDFN